MVKTGYVPSNAKIVTIEGVEFSSLDEVCRKLGISSSYASCKAKREMPNPEDKEKRILRKDEIIIELATKELKFKKMRQDFALGIYSRRPPDV